MFFSACLLVVIAVGAEQKSIVEGTVVDARSGEPIEGAIVSPIVFTPPGFTPNRDLGAKTNAKGEFKVSGVDPTLGINVWHDDYLEFNRDGFEEVGDKTGERSYQARIELKKGEALFGAVNDAAGNPLVDVEVSDGAGKSVRTEKDGSFVLRSPQKWGRDDHYTLLFRKKDYLDKRLSPTSAPPDGLSVALDAQPLLIGRVIDSAGRRVPAFTVSAGAGLEPGRWCCTTAESDDPDGSFSLHVRTDQDYKQTGKIWIAVKAPRHAIWEATIDSWRGAESVVARLQPGVSVFGSAKTPKTAAGPVSAVLLPARMHPEMLVSETSQRQELGRMETRADAAGAFRFEHVAPGEYVLAISGRDVSPVSSIVSVGEADVDAGSFSLSGTGSIYGIAFQNDMICEAGVCRLNPERGVWARAEGSISFKDNSGRSNAEEFAHLAAIPFKTDGHGRFRVDGVPVGTVSVGFPYMITADIVDMHSRIAKVIEGKATEVRFFDTSGEWDVPCRFIIGDGSARQFASGAGTGSRRKVEEITARAPMFQIALTPKGDGPRSYDPADWQELDARREIVLHDVHPGEYRLIVYDWLGSRGFESVICDKAVTVTPHATRLTVELGAGSITGAVRRSKHSPRIIRVVAVGKQTRTLREARCDPGGNFCARYLPPDTYMLFAHDDNVGWRRLPDVSVRNAMYEVGSHALVPGGTIAGEIPARLAKPQLQVTATDERGISITEAYRDKERGSTFKISGLWPGRWTVNLKDGERVLGAKAVRLHGTETAACSFSGE